MKKKLLLWTIGFTISWLVFTLINISEAALPHYYTRMRKLQTMTRSELVDQILWLDIALRDATSDYYDEAAKNPDGSCERKIDMAFGTAYRNAREGLWRDRWEEWEK